MNEIKPGQYVIYNNNPPVTMTKGEMTLRDYFAGCAVQGIIGLLNGGAETLGSVQQHISESAYEIADAMLKARKNEPS